MDYSLNLTFKTSTGEKTSIAIDKVKPEITKDQILAVMDNIITQNIFKTAKGADIIEKVSAVMTEKKNTSYLF